MQLTIPLFLLTVLLFCSIGYLQGVPFNDTNDSLTTRNSAPFIEILRGRDGRDGRDGAQGPRGPPGPPGATGTGGAGVLYTRWGKAICPDVIATELVYDGRVGGSYYTHHGGGANYLCMPDDPEYNLKSISGSQAYSRVYGAEYENPITGTHNHNVPCAVCYVSTRSVVMMIPAKTSCPQSWTREYYGFLMSANDGANGRTMFECVDKDQDSISGADSSTNGVLFYHTEVHDCTGFLCPPYDKIQELNCVVCSK